MPSATLVLMPVLRAPADASAAAMGDVLAEATPLHRSPVALLRVVAGVLALLGAADRAVERFVLGAATALAAEEDTPVADVDGAWTRGAVATAFAAGAGVRVVEPLVERRELTAPLVVAEALELAVWFGAPAVVPEPGVVAAAGPEAAGAGAAGAVAGAGVTGAVVPPAVAGGVTVAGGVGGAAGVAGVPNPAGVQAQAMPPVTAATLSTDRMDKLMMRARDCNGSSPNVAAYVLIALCCLPDSERECNPSAANRAGAGTPGRMRPRGRRQTGLAVGPATHYAPGPCEGSAPSAA